MADQANGGGSEQGSQDGDFDLEQSFVFVEGSDPNFEYPVLILRSDSPEKCCECVAISRIDGKILLAVPDPAWHRRKDRRTIASAALTKVVRVTVASCPLLARDSPEADPSLKVWLGVLAADLEASLVDDEIAAIRFPADTAGSPLVPYAPAMVAVAQDHFAFVTAQEGGQPSTQQRLTKLEDGLEQILKEIGKLRPSEEQKKPQRSILASQAKAAPPAAPGLSNALVHQALQAGVSQAALSEIGGLLNQQVAPTRLDPAAVQDQKELTSDEEDAWKDAEGSGSADPVGRAVVQLSKIVAEMHSDRKKKLDRGLESILDNAESGSQKESTSGGSSRTHAAALGSLQKLLDKNPKLLYQEIEKLMTEDWQTGSAMPGVARMPTSARGWLEHRSKIGNFVGAIRPAWIMAGAWDDLKNGNPARLEQDWHWG